MIFNHSLIEFSVLNLWLYAFEFFAFKALFIIIHQI